MTADDVSAYAIREAFTTKRDVRTYHRYARGIGTPARYTLKRIEQKWPGTSTVFQSGPLDASGTPIELWAMLAAEPRELSSLMLRDYAPPDGDPAEAILALRQLTGLDESNKPAASGDLKVITLALAAWRLYGFIVLASGPEVHPAFLSVTAKTGVFHHFFYLGREEARKNERAACRAFIADASEAYVASGVSNTIHAFLLQLFDRYLNPPVHRWGTLKDLFDWDAIEKKYARKRLRPAKKARKIPGKRHR